MEGDFAWEQDLKDLEKEVDKRHEANLERFSKIETKLAETVGMLKLACALLLANGFLNVYLTTRGK